MTSRAKRSRIEKEAFLCPISHEVMRDPVMTVDGHTYDRANIELVFKTSSLSPKTGLQLPDRRLIPNIALRHAMEEAGITNLVPIELPGPTTQEQAEKFAREVVARSPMKETKYILDKAYEYVKQYWRDAVRDANARGDYFVIVNIIEASDHGVFGQGHFSKLGTGIQPINVSRAAHPTASFVTRNQLAGMIAWCAKESGFPAFKTFYSAYDARFATGFMACVHEEDWWGAEDAAKKYR